MQSQKYVMRKLPFHLKNLLNEMLVQNFILLCLCLCFILAKTMGTIFGFRNLSFLIFVKLFNFGFMVIRTNFPSDNIFLDIQRELECFITLYLRVL